MPLHVVHEDLLNSTSGIVIPGIAVPAIAVPAIAVPAIAVPVPRKRQAGPSGRFPLGKDYGFFVEGIDFVEFYRENRIRRVVGFWRSGRTVRPERTYG